MLNRSKLFNEIKKLSNLIFIDNSREFNLACNAWLELSNDPYFLEKIKNFKSNIILPNWQDNLSLYISENQITNYSIISTDGSQIYPDRHSGLSCFLINIGYIKLNYGSTSSPCNLNNKVTFESTPYVFSCSEEDIAINSTDIVDCKRQELEFQLGLDKSYENSKILDKSLFLFDGSLIFWHLESKPLAVKEFYLSKYLGYLHQFYKNNLLIAGYISLPKSKELINIIRINLLLNNSSMVRQAWFDELTTQHHERIEVLNNITDAQLMQFFLKPFERTILFKNNSHITELYPDYLKPYFIYLNIINEIVRIEIPEFIAKDEKKISYIIGIIIDQAKKGYGYPICLAEAHEQAVVKSVDRELFYQLIKKISIDYKQQIFVSQKSIKKRKINI